MKIIRHKAIKTGDYVEFYTYSKPIIIGANIDRKSFRNDSSSTDNTYSLEKSVWRTKSMIRRLVMGNLMGKHYRGEKASVKFLTLTFGNDRHYTDKDIEQAHYYFKKFKQRLSYRLGKKIYYIGTHELTKKGRIHYHLILFNCPYIKKHELAKMWGYHIKINRTQYDLRAVNYITKYIQKELLSHRDIKGKKRYMHSLYYKPEHFTDKETLARLYSFKENHAVHQFTYNIQDRKGNIVNEVRKETFSINGDML